MIDRIANVVDCWEDCALDLGNKRVHWVMIKDVDWLSMENTGAKSPWHYSKLLSINIGCVDDPVMTVLSWFVIWNRRFSIVHSLRYIDGSLKFADFLLSDGYDDKEVY